MDSNRVHDLLRAFLPDGTPPDRVFSAEVLERARACHERLERLGFRLESGRALLRIRNEEAGFAFVAHLSHPDDLGERRALFRALRTRFGTRRERWFPWLFAAGPRVSETYEALRYLIELCQEARNREPRAA